MTPALSVVMPVWRPDAAFLRRAVASVLDQTFPDFELVIVEDPGGIPVASLLADVVDPRVRLLVNRERTSLVAQRNRGVLEARADLVAMLDADDVAEPERFARQVERFAADPELTVLGSAIAMVGADERVLAVRPYPCEHADIVALMPRENPLAQSAVMVRRGPLLAAGGYRFAIDHTGEDYELWSRLARGGARFANLADVLVRYRIHDGASKATRLRALLRSTLWVKHRYWRADMDAAARLRMLGEAALLHAPPRWVAALFLLTHRLRDACARPRAPAR